MATVSNEFLSVLRNIDALSVSEQQLLAKSLLDVLASPKGASRVLEGEDITDFSERKILCPHCGAPKPSKWGFMRDKVTRRYKCRCCEKTFSRKSNSVISYTHFDMNVWEDFILLTLKGASLATCAKRCGINKNTAFAWRHKIMKALASDLDDKQLADIVEMDETFFRISYKGNHKKSKSFKMPRAPYMRGSDNRGEMKDRACVFCAVQRGVKSYAAVVCRGAITSEMLKNVIPPHVSPNSIVLTDGLHAYTKYFKNAPQVHRGIKAKTKGKGAYHINNINNFHARLKFFLAQYHGVSTKYLGNYIGMFAWLENARLLSISRENSTAKKMLEFGSFCPVREFSTWTRQPELAPAAKSA